jgi:hypothetical protein
MIGGLSSSSRFHTVSKLVCERRVLADRRTGLVQRLVARSRAKKQRKYSYAYATRLVLGDIRCGHGQRERTELQWSTAAGCWPWGNSRGAVASGVKTKQQ